MTIATVGVVGLGNMGLGMAATLARKGFTVLGYDLSPARRPAAEAAGVTTLNTLNEVLQAADALVFSLPLARDVEAVVTAEGGLLSRTDRKVVVVDTSTSDPGTTRRLAERLAAAGHALLDAPVSGGPSGAAEGTLTMMVGGAEADYALARPVLEAMSARAHVGPSGAGNIVKLVNNLLVAAHLVTTGEALRLSEAAGLSADEAVKVVNTATGRSAISEVMVPRWVQSGTFDSGFSAGLMRKDVRLALELAAECGIDLPLSAEVKRIWQATQAAIPDTADFTRMADYRDPKGAH